MLRRVTTTKNANVWIQGHNCRANVSVPNSVPTVDPMPQQRVDRLLTSECSRSHVQAFNQKAMYLCPRHQERRGTALWSLSATRSHPMRRLSLHSISRIRYRGDRMDAGGTPKFTISTQSGTASLRAVLNNLTTCSKQFQSRGHNMCHGSANLGDLKGL